MVLREGTALALPVIAEGRLSAEHAALCLASLGFVDVRPRSPTPV
jgi:hypothetical protein